VGYGVEKYNLVTKKFTRLYDFIDDIHETDLLAQLAMSEKLDDELIIIMPGENRGIKRKPEEYQVALQLAEKYKAD